jgi:uncharacterized protein (TIGR03435 family)
MHNTQLELVIPYAYHIPRGYPLEGDLNAPDTWKWFDIEAIAPGSPSDDEIRLMFQSLLEDRFKLRVHHETQQREVFALVPGRRTPKLKEWQPGAKPLGVRDRPVPEGAVGNFSSREEPYQIVGRKVPITKLASYLTLMLRTPIIDKTGLSGDFDFELVWGTQGEGRPSGPPDSAEVGSSASGANWARACKVQGTDRRSSGGSLRETVRQLAGEGHDCEVHGSGLPGQSPTHGNYAAMWT